MVEPVRRISALAEITVVFVLTLVAVGLVARSAFATWEIAHIHRPFAEYLALALVPFLFIITSRKPLADWGLSFRPLREHVDSALKCIGPFAIGQTLAMAVRRDAMVQSLVESVAAIAALVVCARLLRLKPPPAVSLAALAFVGSVGVTPSRAVSAFAFYILFLAPGEELLFRGYIQSRLNRAFGRPYVFMGAPFGAGLVVAAVLFSLFHVVNLPMLYAGMLQPLWWRALPTLAWGLLFGYLRERTGSILAPALVHGVPQALAWAFLGL